MHAWVHHVKQNSTQVVSLHTQAQQADGFGTVSTLPFVLLQHTSFLQMTGLPASVWSQCAASSVLPFRCSLSGLSLCARCRALGDALAAREELISALLRGAAAQGTPGPSRSRALALSPGGDSQHRMPVICPAGSPRISPADRDATIDATVDANCSEAGGGTPASQPVMAAAVSVCSGVCSVDGSPALGGIAQRDSGRVGKDSHQGSSCSGGGGGSTGLPGEPSAGRPPQAGQASAFSSILQRSGRDALALLTPESRQVAGGALPGRLGLWLGSQALACPTGLSPLAVLATPAALPSWLDRQALAASCAGLTGQGLGLLPAPLSPLPTPAWLRATPPAEAPQPGESSAVSAGTPPEPVGLRLMWETPSAGAPAWAGVSPPGGTSAESTGLDAFEPECGLRLLTQSPERLGSCSVCSNGHAGGEIPTAACATTLSHARSAQGSAKVLLASRECGSPSARGLAEGAADSSAVAVSAHRGAEASPSPPSLSFQGFRAPAVPSAQAIAQPWEGPASLSPSVAALATPQAPGSPQVSSSQGASLRTLDLSPNPRQGPTRVPDTAERQLVGRLHAQLEAGSGSPQALGHEHGHAGTTRAAAERGATFLRAINRLQAR